MYVLECTCVLNKLGDQLLPAQQKLTYANWTMDDFGR